MQRDLDRGQTARLASTDADERAIPREDDRIAGHVPDGAPREQQVGQFLERRPTLGNDLELRPVDLRPILCLDQQATVDAMEVETRDAVFRQPLVGRGRHCE